MQFLLKDAMQSCGNSCKYRRRIPRDVGIHKSQPPSKQTHIPSTICLKCAQRFLETERVAKALAWTPWEREIPAPGDAFCRIAHTPKSQMQVFPKPERPFLNTRHIIFTRKLFFLLLGCTESKKWHMIYMGSK